MAVFAHYLLTERDCQQKVSKTLVTCGIPSVLYKMYCGQRNIPVRYEIESFCRPTGLPNSPQGHRQTILNMLNFLGSSGELGQRQNHLSAASSFRNPLVLWKAHISPLSPSLPPPPPLQPPTQGMQKSYKSGLLRVARGEQQR